MSKTKNHFTYIAVIIATCAMATASLGILNSAVGVFFTPVSSDLGVGRGTFSMHITIQAIMGAFFTLYVSRVYKRFDFKLIVLVSTLAMVFSTFLMGKATHVYQFYALGAIRGGASAFVGMFPISILIHNWFVEKRGLVTSIVMSFTGVAGAVFSPLFARLITEYGWQHTYNIVALSLLLLGTPIFLYPFKLDPKDQGILPYGDKDESQPKLIVEKTYDFDFMQTSFLLYIIISVLYSGMTGIAQYLSGYAETLNYSATFGATLVSATMIGSIVSKLIIGVIADKRNALDASIVMMISSTVGLVLLLIAKPNIILYAGSLLFGAAYSLGSVATMLLTSYFFGSEHHNLVFPRISFAASMGNAILISLIGFIYDFTQSYIPVFIIGISVYTLIFVLLHIIKTQTLVTL